MRTSPRGVDGVSYCPTFKLMKKLFGLLVAACVAFTLTTATLNAETLEIKPSTTNVVVATLQDAVGLSFKIEKLPSTNTLSDLQKSVFAADESALQGIVLKGKAGESETRQELDVFATYKTFSSKEGFSEIFESPYVFGKAFAFTNTPTGQVSLIVELVRKNALAGDYLVTVSDSNGRKVSEQLLRVVPEYSGDVSYMLARRSCGRKLPSNSFFRSSFGRVGFYQYGLFIYDFSVFYHRVLKSSEIASGQAKEKCRV